MTDFIQTIEADAKAAETDVVDFVSAERKAAIAALEPSIAALAAYAEKNGVAELEALAAAIFTGAATAAVTGNVTPAAIGAAAIAAAAPLVKNDITGASNEVRAIATAAVTNVAAAIAPAATTTAGA